MNAYFTTTCNSFSGVLDQIRSSARSETQNMPHTDHPSIKKHVTYNQDRSSAPPPPKKKKTFSLINRLFESGIRW